MKIKITLLLLLATSLIYSQNTLTGTVENLENSEAISYANVYFPELEKGTITNENGEFEINNLPYGNYNIVVSQIGFESYSKDISIGNNQLNLNVALIPSAIEMDEIIVSTPFHKLQADNVMKVEQQNISELKKNGATTLAQGITNVPGVEIISTGNSIGKPVIRGLSSNRVLVYNQGVRLENQQFGAEHGLGLNDAGIESVEVIKGPASLLYGSDALGGVLYFNPERFAPLNSKNADVNLNYYSNTKGKNTNIGFKQSANTFKFLIRGSHTEHSDYDTKQYRVTNTRFNEKDLKVGLGYQKSNYKTEFRYNLNSSKIGIPEEIGVQSNNVTPLLPFQQLNNHIFSNKTSIYLKKSSIKFNLGYTYNDRKEFEEHHEHDHEEINLDEEHDEHDEHEEENTSPALHMKLKTFNYDVKYNLPQTGKIETIVGVQGMNQTNTNYGEELLIPNATTKDFGVLTTSHIHFEKIALQLGVRYDNRNIEALDLNKNFSSFNGAIGIKTDFSERFVSRLNIASGFRSPNLSELTSYGSHHGANRFEIGNPNLDNEQNLQTDLALEYKNKHIEVSINGFYNSINNYIFLLPNGEVLNNDPIYTYAQNDAKLYGGEIGLHFHPHPLDWLHAESSFETVTGKLNNDNYLPLIPANKWNNTLRVEFNKKKWFQNSYAFLKVNTTFKQGNISEFETATDGYTLLDVGFGRTIQVFKNELEFNASITNLTNKEYISHLSRLKPDDILNMGRSINFGLSYKL